MSTNLKWYKFDDTDATEYRVYRSIHGFKVAFPNSLMVGDELIFSATNKDIQKVLISSTDIGAIANNINNQAKGLRADVAANGYELLIRTIADTNPKLKLYKCSFLNNAGIVPGLISPATVWEKIATIPLVSDQTTYEFEDVDGFALDYYKVSSATDVIEHIPSVSQQSVIAPEDSCVIEGRVIDNSNRPVIGAEVRVGIKVPVGVQQNSGILAPNAGTKTVFTDEIGRWSVPVLRNQLYLFQIPVIGYNEVIQTPDAPFILFRQLVPVKDHLFSISGEPNL